MARRATRSTTAAGLLAAVLALGGCGSEGVPADGGAAGSDVVVDPRGLDDDVRKQQSVLFDSLRAYDGVVEFLFVPRTLNEALPNQQLRVHFNWDEEPKVEPSSAAFVVGKVVSAEPGRSVIVSEDDKSTEVDYFDERPHAFSGLINIEVEKAWGEVKAGSTIQVEVGSHGSMGPRELLDTLASLGRVAIALSARNEDEGAYLPNLGGALLGRVGDDDTLSFPAIANPEEFLAGIKTVGDIDEAMTNVPPKTIYLGLKPGDKPPGS